MSVILVTGAAGFIGYFLSQQLLAQGHRVIGIDNLNDYYDVRLKQQRLEKLNQLDEFTFHPVDISQQQNVEAVFAEHAIEKVVHLAAQAGVRYSIENPRAYIESNVDGFFNVIEACRLHDVVDFLYASSSSVYGNHAESPLHTGLNVDAPVSLYAATKKSNELVAHTYSHIYGMRTTGLRFFTVYGPMGRPDMAYFKFANAMFAGQTIDVYNHGDLYRDFTYIDDIVEGIVRLVEQQRNEDASYRVFNIGNHSPVKLLDFIEILEDKLGKKADKRFLEMQPGDVYSTCADVTALRQEVGFEPNTQLEQGLENFAKWYKEVWAPLR